MLTQLCQELHNWFCRGKERYEGIIKVQSDGRMFCTNSILDNVEIVPKTGQYVRLIDSDLNDGVHKYPDDTMTEETFDGAVQFMAVPPAVVQLADDIKAWQDKYGDPTGTAMSPFRSESYSGVYSYNKGGSGNGGSATSWQSVFASRLNAWRKV